MAGIRFLSIEDVLQIQQDTIAIEGGLAGLRDAGLLASAVMMPGRLGSPRLELAEPVM